MRNIFLDYKENVQYFDKLFSPNQNFDMIKKVVKIGNDELTFYYIDGFIKGDSMQKLILSLMGLNKIEDDAIDFCYRHIPHVEANVTGDIDFITLMVMSGACLCLGSKFNDKAIIIDARSYPARETQEPENDKVMKGSRDGFVETLIYNTALIRRRIRDTSLKMEYFTVGSLSRTDVVVCYLEGKANPKYVNYIKEKISSIKTKALTVGLQSISECLIKTHWYNPFPKVRMTERPDSASAQICEGNIVIICDNTPEVMILPTGIFDFLQETNDYYFPPLTGTYLRILRYVIFSLTMILMPLWYLGVQNPSAVPEFLQFSMPEDSGKLPIIVQLYLTEFLIDGLRLASMNTPGILNNSLSVIGGLLLGDLSIKIGWLIPEVILYGAFVAIANFSQRNYELGYAFKFLRMLLLLFTFLGGLIGFFAGIAVVLTLIVTNQTLNGEFSYLYPLIPFNKKAFMKMIFRRRKDD